MSATYCPYHIMGMSPAIDSPQQPMKGILGSRDIKRGSCESLQYGMRGLAFGFIG